MSRIGQLMPSMTENIDYVTEKRGNHGTRIVFTESGISKVMNRNRLHYSERVEDLRRIQMRESCRTNTENKKIT